MQVNIDQMKKIVQFIDKSLSVVQLCATSVFPGKGDEGTILPVINWNTKQNGKGISYDGLQTISILSSFNLYARYKGITRELTYFYVDGTVENESITEAYTLKYPSTDNFKGWIVNGIIYTPPYTEKTVEKDINAYMSCYGNYTLTYDPAGGIGSIPSVTKPASIWVEPNGSSTSIKSKAERVKLAKNVFSKSFIADDALSYDLIRGKWIIDGKLSNENDLIAIDQNKNAIAQWLYPVFYKIDVTCSPLGAANIEVIGVGSTPQQQRMSNAKTLIVRDILDGYKFAGWYRGTELKSVDPVYSATIQIQDPIESQCEVTEKYIAKFDWDKRYTIVTKVDNTQKMKNVSGKLTRAMLLNDASITAVANQSNFPKIIIRGMA